MCCDNVKPWFNGLDGTGRARRKPRAGAGEEPAVRVPEARSRSPKSPQWGAERRASGDPDARAARRWTSRALLGAPLPHVCEGGRTEGAPRAFQKTGAAERWLNGSTGCLKIESVLRCASNIILPETERDKR